MSVGNCVLPWHWLLIDISGDVQPCGHGSGSVGNLRDSTIEEIWNGDVMVEVRASILAGKVHRVCQTADCPFQRRDAAFPEPTARIHVKEAFARNFDEAWYVREYPDVREAVAKGRFASGLEHFIRHGRAEGRLYKLVEPERLAQAARAFRSFAGFVGKLAAASEKTRLHNAVLALVEYSQGLTRLEAKPTDVVFVVSTICNLRCVMCPHGMGLVDSPRHMPAEWVDKAAPVVAASSRMIISGLGEPTLAPAFWRILELTKEREGLFIRVNSNGHFLTPEKASAILDSRLSEISFSLDAATAGTYAKIRGGDFARALAGISTMLRSRAASQNRRIEILINMTLMRENIPEAAAFVALGKELGADGIIFTQLFAFGDRPDWRVDRDSWSFVYSEQMLARAPDEATRQISQARRVSEELDVPVHFLNDVLAYAG
jgi:MoaA/NifB/PqqE/SkfB family radical SAM enzyme